MAMRTQMILTLVALAALVSCTKESFTPDAEPEASKGISFELTASHPNDTKALKTAWEPGDAVFVFFSNVAAPKYLKMSFDGSSWQNTEMDGDSPSAGCLGLSNGVSGTMRAVYLPFGSSATVSASSGSFVFSEDYYTYYLTDSQSYTVENNKVSGTFQMAVPDGFVQFFVDDADALAGQVIELREPHLTPVAVASVTADGIVLESSLAHGAPMPGYVYDKAEKTGTDSNGFLFSGVLVSSAQNTATDYHFTLVKGGFSGDYYYKEFAGKTLYKGASAGRAIKLPVIADWNVYTDFKPIDMGCDSHLGGKEYKRIYWANRNLGATADTGADAFGDFFAWGELESNYEAGYARETPGTHWKDGKNNGYAWTSYTKFNPSGDGATFTKYTGDDYATLQPEDDMATQTLGGLWRIPTKTDWRCLYYTLEDEDGDGFVGESVSDILTWTFKSEGTSGYTVTSSAAGCEGNSIFLPLAGRRNNKNLYDYKANKEKGQYWSSTLYYTSDIWDPASIVYQPQYAYGASIDRPSDTGQGPLFTGNLARNTGRSIRPVMD